MRYQAATLIICASLGLFGVRADAQTTQEPPQVVGVGIAVLPEFEGSDRYQVVPFPIANIGVGGNRLDVSGLSAKVDLLEISTFRLGPSAGLQFARDDNAEDSRIALLDPVDFSIELGGFIGFSVPSPNRRTEISGELTVHQDVAGGHGGGVAMANLQYGHQINRQWRATLGSNVAYGGSDYMDSFYTVSPEAAIRSGLPGFDADAGLKSASVRLGSSYAFSPGWGVFGQAAYTRLLGDAKDSPVVNLAGNADQVFFGVGVFRTY